MPRHVPLISDLTQIWDFLFFFHRRRSAPELKKVADNTTDSEDEAGIDDLDDDVYLPPTNQQGLVSNSICRIIDP